MKTKKIITLIVFVLGFATFANAESVQPNHFEMVRDLYYNASAATLADLPVNTLVAGKSISYKNVGVVEEINLLVISNGDEVVGLSHYAELYGKKDDYGSEIGLERAQKSLEHIVLSGDFEQPLVTSAQGTELFTVRKFANSCKRYTSFRKTTSSGKNLLLWQILFLGGCGVTAPNGITTYGYNVLGDAS